MGLSDNEFSCDPGQFLVEHAPLAQSLQRSQDLMAATGAKRIVYVTTLRYGSERVISQWLFAMFGRMNEEVRDWLKALKECRDEKCREDMEEAWGMVELLLSMWKAKQPKELVVNAPAFVKALARFAWSKQLRRKKIGVITAAVNSIVRSNPQLQAELRKEQSRIPDARWPPI